MRLAARRSAVQAATDAQRQLHALVVAAPETFRGRLRNLTTARLVSRCARLRQRSDWDPEIAATPASLRALARRIQLLEAEIADHTRAITTLVRAWRPDLLTRCGVGPIVAAIVLCAWSTRAAAQAMPPSPCWVAPRPSPLPQARRCGCG